MPASIKKSLLLLSVTACFGVGLALPDGLSAFTEAKAADSQMASQVVKAKVKEVLSGDTVIISSPSGTQKISLMGVQAPDVNLPAGIKSKESLQQLLAKGNNELMIQHQVTDKWGRFIGRLLGSDMDINLQQLKDGHAWTTNKILEFNTPEEQTLYQKMQEEARTLNKGLWAGARNTDKNVMTVGALHVISGDSIVVSSPSGISVVRMVGIKAPSMKQPAGEASRASLSEALEKGNGHLDVYYKVRDKWGRYIGKIVSEGMDLNLHQIKNGQAWLYQEFKKDIAPSDLSLYEKVQQEAKTLNKGVWKDPQAQKQLY